MLKFALALAALLVPALAGADPIVETTNPSSSEVRYTITFDGTTAASVTMERRGICRGSFVRAGSETVSLYETNSVAATGGVLAETFNTTSAFPSRIDVSLSRFYASSDGATAGGVLTVSCYPLSAAIRGIRGAQASASISVPSTGNPWISCSGLPEPSFTPISVTTADDLHDVVTAECGAGCILDLAPGTYDDTNVTIGPVSDSNIKAGSLDGTDITGEIYIRAANPADPPVLRAEIGNPAAIFYLVNNPEMFRLKDLILDGRRSEQTNAVVSACPDTTPADGICDSGTQTFSDATGFNTRSTIAVPTRSCLENVTVRNTVIDGIFIRNAVASTVENVTVSGVGCAPSTCPGISIPADFSTNSYSVVGRGINMVDSDFVAVVDSTFTDGTKQGIQCFGTTRCYVVDNVISDIGNAGITILGSTGYVWRNTISDIGFNFPPNTTATATGNGITFTDSDPYSGDIEVDFTGNSVTNTHGSSYWLALGTSPAAESSTITMTNNTGTDACVTSTRSDSAAFLLGDGSDRLESLTITGNTVTGNRCPAAFRVRNVIAYTADDNTVTGSVGSTQAVVYDDVESMDDDGLVVDADISIDVDSVGTLTNCTLNGSASVTGSLEGGVVRSNCGPPHTGGSSLWDAMTWDSDVWG